MILVFSINDVTIAGDWVGVSTVEHACSCGRARLRTAWPGLCVWPCWAGIKGLWGGPLLLLYHCGCGPAGGGPWPTEGSPLTLASTSTNTWMHPLRHIQTHTHTQTRTVCVGHTRLGRTVWRNEMVWKGLMASGKSTRRDKKRKSAEEEEEWMKGGKCS